MTETSDQALLGAARSGDRQALEELLLRYQPRVYRFGMKMCGDPEDARDILQETLLAMARGVGDFRGASSISTWLYTIARNFCLKKRRHRPPTAHGTTPRSDTDQNEAAQIPDPRPNPEQVTESRQIDAILASAIASLEPTHREVLVLRDVEGLGAADVAEVVGISVQAVKSRLHRARRALREALVPHLGEAATPEAAKPGCPDVIDLFSRHLEGEISANTCAEMERHLSGCEHCRHRCDSLKASLNLCHSSATPAVPAEVQTAIRTSIRQLVDARHAPRA